MRTSHHRDDAAASSRFVARTSLPDPEEPRSEPRRPNPRSPTSTAHHFAYSSTRDPARPRASHAEMLGHFRVQRRFQHILGNRFKNPSGPVKSSPCSRAWSTIATAATCRRHLPTSLLDLIQLTLHKPRRHHAQCPSRRTQVSVSGQETPFGGQSRKPLEVAAIRAYCRGEGVWHAEPVDLRARPHDTGRGRSTLPSWPCRSSYLSREAAKRRLTAVSIFSHRGLSGLKKVVMA